MTTTNITTSKMAQARVLFTQIHTPGYNLEGRTQRAEFLRRAQLEIVNPKTGEVACSKNCAGTYYQNISDNVNKGLGLYHRNKPAKKKPTQADVKSMEAQVLLALPHLAKERWMVVNESGQEVNNFKTRTEAQNFAKVKGLKAADRNKAA